MPVEGSGTSSEPTPWILHSLAVNTLSFCSFASCPVEVKDGHSDLLVALPSADERSVLLYRLPEESIVSRIPTGTHEQTGMLMALSLSHCSGATILGAAFEIGVVCAWRKEGDGQEWAQLFNVKHHTQPVLSLQIMPDLTSFLSSGADAIVVRYPLDGSSAVSSHTKHAGQQGLQIRSDGRIFATAGWDGRGRVYSTRTLQEVAVLKWHKEGCYASAFADINPTGMEAAAGEMETTAVNRRDGSVSVAQKRQTKVQSTHWLAIGSKDGRVSLWDVF